MKLQAVISILFAYGTIASPMVDLERRKDCFSGSLLPRSPLPLPQAAGTTDDCTKFSIATLCALATTQGPNKPAVDKHYELNKVEKGAQRGCRVEANSQGHRPEDCNVYSVHYDDCAEPWHMCVHTDSTSTKEHLADQFGKLPVDIRSHVATEYAKNSWMENFAETKTDKTNKLMLALFDKNVPNARDKGAGLWKNPKKWDGFNNQLDLIFAKVGGKIILKKGVKCAARLQNDKAVAKNAKTSKRELGLIPDLRIRDPSIKFIEVDRRGESVC
ncbi:hypothetical protein PspLS_09914 [Pyricularia sp. CBS 133598]|nr:hypothetical protein PspLS_09914 [Pyricularia sp. CBS 133598]